MSSIEVAIIGAGPYGLSVAAHLTSRGVPNRIIGEPMQTWRPMPRNLCLKSLGFATNLSVGEPGADFPSWLAARGLETLEPISYADFTEYGLSIQRKYVPHAEPTRVTRLDSAGERRFQLTLATGELVEARSAVLAIGLGAFQHLPEELRQLPRELLSHSFGSYSFARFAGQEVAVVGAGQSALECAVLLHEAGARPVLLSRSPPVFHGRTPRRRPLLERVLEPLSVLGAGRTNWLLGTFPWLPRHAPEDRRVRLARTFLGPAGAWWLRDRFEGKVPVRSPVRIVSAREVGGQVGLVLDEGGTEREARFAHVVAATGFQHDLRRLEFITPALAAQVNLIQDRAPRLSSAFETSVPGLHVVGPFSAYAFGPLFRFVCGATYTAPVVARRLASGRSRPWTRSRSASPDEPLPGGRRAA